MGQASGGKKYPTDFTTFEEFWSICRSIRRTDTRNEWISRIPGCRLHIKRDDGLSVALYLFFKKWLPIERLTKDMAFLDNGSGYTILQKLAEDHAVPEDWFFLPDGTIDETILFFTPEYGGSFAREMVFVLAENGGLPGSVLTRDMLFRVSRKGCTLAHSLALGNILPEKYKTEDILRLRNDTGDCVAHYLAMNNRLPENALSEELLLLVNSRGETVAHLLAYRGALPKDWMTKRILAAETSGTPDKTVAMSLFRFAYSKNDWAALHPEIFETDNSFQTKYCCDRITHRFTAFDRNRRAEALSGMPSETLRILLRLTGKDTLRHDIGLELDSRTLRESGTGALFSDSPEIETGGADIDEIYCCGAERN